MTVQSIRLHNPLSEAGTRWLAIGVATVGYMLALIVIVQHGSYTLGGAGGVDLFAYWNAGANLLAGLPVYGAPPGSMSAYLYPPPVAQVFAPLSLVPFPIVVWGWRILQLVWLRLAVGSWVGGGIALLVWPPTIAELDACNVHLLIAAAVGLTIRGQAGLVFPVALVKFASLVAVPLAVLGSWRSLWQGLLVALAIGAVSFVLAPDMWFTYARFLFSTESIELSWYALTATVPLWVRLALAGVVALVAVRWARLLPVAAVLALPILWFSGLSILVACASTPVRRDPMPLLAGRIR